MSNFTHRSLSLLFKSILSLLLLLAANPPAIGNTLGSYPAGDFSCTITFDWDGSSKEPAPPGAPLPQGSQALQKMKIERVGKTMRYQFQWAGNRISEIWRDAETGLFVQQSDDPHNKSIYIDSQVLVWVPPLGTMTQDTIGWIDGSNLKEEVVFNGRKALRYERKMSFPSGATPLYQAWIDKETKRPIGFHDGEALYSLNYASESPAGPLIMPPVLRQELDRQLKASKGPSYL